MIKRLLLLLLILFPASLMADENKVATFYYKYPLDALTLTYCKVTGQNNDPFGPPRANDFRIKTTGSSTSVTENTASTNPFTDLALGDILVVARPDGTTDTRVIVVRTDAANVTIDSAVDWTGGFAFRWLKQSCGTTANDGWITVAGWESAAITFSIEQMNVTGGIDVRWECKGDSISALPVILYPGETDGCGGGTLGTNVCNFTTAGITSRLTVEDFGPWGSCRMGVVIHTNDDGGDLTTNEEQIMGYIQLEQRR